MPIQTSFVTVCLLSLNAVIQQNECWLTWVLNIVIETWVALVMELQHSVAVDRNNQKF